MLIQNFGMTERVLWYVTTFSGVVNSTRYQKVTLITANHGLHYGVVREYRLFDAIGYVVL